MKAATFKGINGPYSQAPNRMGHILFIMPSGTQESFAEVYGQSEKSMATATLLAESWNLLQTMESILRGLEWWLADSQRFQEALANRNLPPVNTRMIKDKIEEARRAIAKLGRTVPEH